MTKFDLSSEIYSVVQDATVTKSISVAHYDVGIDEVLDKNQEIDSLRMTFPLVGPAQDTELKDSPVLSVVYKHKRDLSVYIDSEIVQDDIVMKRHDTLYSTTFPKSGLKLPQIVDQVALVMNASLPTIEDVVENHKNVDWIVPREMQPYLDTTIPSLYGEYAKDVGLESQKRIVLTNIDHSRYAPFPMTSEYKLMGCRPVNGSKTIQDIVSQVKIHLSEVELSTSDTRLESLVYCIHEADGTNIRMGMDYGSKYWQERKAKGLPRPSVSEVLDDFRSGIKREFERKRSLAASEIADAIAVPEEPQL